MSDDPAALHAFGGYGIELEYMIVDSASLSVAPIADRLLRQATGADSNDVDRGMLGWSNEMVLHLIEIKNLRPVASLSMLPDAFGNEIRAINRILEGWGARLMPGAMHPWMDPRTETRLWPHDNHAIYRAYDRIFDSNRHGWANLQSMHVNLPFAGDAEFARLHAAVRLALPILPALAASSPIAEQRDARCADYRMHVYCGNSDRIPSISGMVIPENSASRAEYEASVLAPMYRDVAPHDTDHVLRYEWLNSHGAIARFDRNAIEIRVIDTQECPRADMAIAAAAGFVVRTLYHSDALPLAALQAISTPALAAILHACIRDAEQAVVDNAAYLELLDYPATSCTAGELWHRLVERMLDEAPEHAAAWEASLQVMLQQGSLSRRILRAVDSDYSMNHLQRVYRELCDCLQEDRMFGVSC
ncbi:glutamate--cysteine ligase [Noviherbaspirillum cavernae]|uniref:Glutamate--cysteine ligase n=1 Tax=Noviherbaspirillum cavernae TaxID=2320862 RepID=A0A418X2P8_9BURK|nr:glutamate-cysteine ligase family protein [Noviherbaspirillum cavernae]RJG06705.1 glutamate--cysteine ligase [Noviherbaspirillum cavernae]